MRVKGVWKINSVILEILEIEFNDLDRCLKGLWISFPIWSLPGGNHIKQKTAQMLWMKTMHTSSQINNDIYSKHCTTDSLAVSSLGKIVSICL